MNSIIIYSTKYGCTEKAANILRKKMTGKVSLVDLAKAKVPNLNDYDTVILGGSIYVGKIQKALTTYVNSNLPDLLKKRVGLFICAGQPEPVCTKELEEAFPAELYQHAAAKDVFGCEYRFDKLKWLDKLMVRKVAGITESKYDLSEQKISDFAKAIEKEV